MVKVLHTSDWHVGKTIRGNSRADEHRAVLGEIVSLADREAVDVVVVAGDLFETATPTPEAEEIVYRALLGLASTGAAVLVIAGNHDNAHRLRAVAPLLALGRVQLLTEASRPDDGGVVRVAGRNGEEIAAALLPFVSQRGIVRVDHLMDGAAFEHAQRYAERLGRLIQALTVPLPDDVPSLLVAHAFVDGGARGGGERQAHIAEEYAVVPQSFPPTVGYVALGHLHRAQKLPGATAIHYCGSPLQLDFGETQDGKQVNLVDLRAGVPAKVNAVTLDSGIPLVTLSGTVAAIADAARQLGTQCWIRARVTEPRRASLADEVGDAVGDHREHLVEVQVVSEVIAADTPSTADRQGHSPRELFEEFLAGRGVEDERLGPAFDVLYEQAMEPST